MIIDAWDACMLECLPASSSCVYSITINMKNAELDACIEMHLQVKFTVHNAVLAVIHSLVPLCVLCVCV